MRRKDSFKTYLPFALNVFQKNLSYRANAIIFIFGDVMMLAVSYYLWKAVYGSSSGSIIKGFTLNEMIIYILILSNLYFLNNSLNFSNILNLANKHPVKKCI